MSASNGMPTPAARRGQAEAIIRGYVLWSAGGGLIPIPLADLAAVTALQMGMLEQLSGLYGVAYSQPVGKRFVTALTGSTAAKLGASLLKLIPGLGTVAGGVAMSVASGASTYAVGQVAVRYFEEALTLDDVDVEEAKVAYEEAFEEGRQVVADLKAEEAAAPGPTVDSHGEVFEALDKLGALRDKGLLTDEEFEAQKRKLLDRL